MRDCPRITVDQFDWNWFDSIPLEKNKRRGNPGSMKMRQRQFIDCVTAFDIETTKVHFKKNKHTRDSYINSIIYNKLIVKRNSLKTQKEKDAFDEKYGLNIHSFMYVWQWQFDDHCTVVGRQWSEFINFVKELYKHLGYNKKLAIYVHNLSFEFQFLKGIYQFKSDEIFAINKRKILKCFMCDGALEYRCSYLHSNMSLKVFAEKMECDHQKMIGDLDYDVERFPWTSLTEKEWGYCVNDVICLVEAIKKELEVDGDTLSTIPATSTGYVRRDMKKAMKAYRNVIQDIYPDDIVYEMLREEFGGGDTHASRFYANVELDHVYSHDRCSSYPDVQMNCEFPMGKWFIVKKDKITVDDIVDLVQRRHKACIFRVAMSNVRLKDDLFACPYLSISKCRKYDKKKTLLDNGRVLKSDYLEVTFNDVDFDIFINEYDFDDIYILNLAHSTYGKLPSAFRAVVQKYFELKTSLKDVPGQEIYYIKNKNKLNACFGMTAEKPVRDEMTWDGLKFDIHNTKSVHEKLEESKKDAFIVYQWGCWTTAWARYRLHEMIWAVGYDYVYDDTDSVKHLNPHTEIIDEYNQLRIADSKKNGAYAQNKNGDTFYMGVYELDGVYKKFKTLGAKKYAYIKDGINKKTGKPYELEITISGVVKDAGAKELAEAGGISKLKAGFKFVKGGGTCIYYNDIAEPFTVKVPDGNVTIVSNAVVENDTYTVSLDKDYSKLIEDSKKFLTMCENYSMMKYGTKQLN